MFERGEEHWETLLNLAEGFQRHKTTHLAASMLADVELYEQHVDEMDEPAAPPDLVEETTVVSLLKTIVELLQVNNFYLTKRPGKPQIERLPRAVTAHEAFVARNTRKAFLALEAAIKFVSQEQWERTLREHEGQAVILDGDVHGGHRNARRPPVPEGVSPETRGGAEGRKPDSPG
ncbi:hypothetical protein ACWEOE_28895 [Amycolatopsis sp. NPDC004368]